MEGAFGDTFPVALFQGSIPFHVGPEPFRDRRVRDEGLIFVLGQVVQLLPAFDLLCKVRPEAIIQAAGADFLVCGITDVQLVAGKGHQIVILMIGVMEPVWDLLDIPYPQ